MDNPYYPGGETVTNDGIDVVIPARNEAKTISPIVNAFVDHPAINHVIVVVDKDTTDDTTVMANLTLNMVNGWVLNRMSRGKGQGATLGLNDVTTDYVIFCDADIRGLTHDHISLLIADAVLGEDSMTIGIPDLPPNYPSNREWAWPWVSGERCLPTRIVRPLKLHGYLMETQINRAASHAKIPVRMEHLPGLKSDFQMNAKRILEMQRDRDWARGKRFLL